MQITIHNPNKLPTLDYRLAKPLQENLKDLHTEQHDKLVKVLQKRGFTQPLNLWLHNGAYYVCDGHQRSRVMTLNDMNDNGSYEVPYFITEARTKQEAVEQLLEITSQYGKTTPDGLDELASMYELELDSLDVHFDSIDLEKLMDGMYDDKPEKGEEPKGEAGVCEACGQKLKHVA